MFPLARKIWRLSLELALHLLCYLRYCRGEELRSLLTHLLCLLACLLSWLHCRPLGLRTCACNDSLRNMQRYGFIFQAGFHDVEVGAPTAPGCWISCTAIWNARLGACLCVLERWLYTVLGRAQPEESLSRFWLVSPPLLIRISSSISGVCFCELSENSRRALRRYG